MIIHISVHAHIIFGANILPRAYGNISINRVAHFQGRIKYNEGLYIMIIPPVKRADHKRPGFFKILIEAQLYTMAYLRLKVRVTRRKAFWVTGIHVGI